MSTYNIVASTNEATVVAEYVSKRCRSDVYQSEAELEREFILLLTTQGYEYLTIGELFSVQVLTDVPQRNYTQDR